MSSIKSLTDRTKDLEDVLESGLLDTLSVNELFKLEKMILEYKDFLVDSTGFNLHYQEVIDIIRLKRGDDHDG